MEFGAADGEHDRPCLARAKQLEVVLPSLRQTSKLELKRGNLPPRNHAGERTICKYGGEQRSISAPLVSHAGESTICEDVIVGTIHHVGILSRNAGEAEC